MKPVTSFTKKAFTLGAMTVLSAGAVLAAPGVQAATYYNLDFERTSANASSKADKDLNPFRLDRSGGQYGFGTTSGKNSIGDIWLADGIQITGYSGNYFSDNYQNRNEITYGLFDSACEIGTNDCNQTNNRGKCQRKVDGQTDGDNDLATGISVAHDGSDTHVTYFNYDGTIDSREKKKTPDLGNLLIFEENPGDGAPDDTKHGGVITFDVSSKNWFLEEIGFVDDISGGLITYTFADDTMETDAINIAGDNKLEFYSPTQAKEIKTVAVKYYGSGAISGKRFKEAEQMVPRIPEPTATLGLAIFGAIAIRLKRQA